MEILVDQMDGMPESSIVSIRMGATRRQAPLESLRARPLKFPQAHDASCEPLKIDVLQPIASGRLMLQPEVSSYQIGLETKDEQPMTIGLKFQASPADSNTDSIQIGHGQLPKYSSEQDIPAAVTTEAAARYHDAALSAREYLDSHRLLQCVQALLSAVLQERPSDPKQFMIQQLGAARQDGSHDLAPAANGEVHSPVKPPMARPAVPRPTPLLPETAKRSGDAVGPNPVSAPKVAEAADERCKAADPSRNGVKGNVDLDLSTLKERARSVLAHACKSGEMQKAMQLLRKSDMQASPDRELEDLRTKMSSLFDDATVSSRLEHQTLAG